MIVTVFFFTSDYDSIQSLDFRHVWYFEPILEDNVLFVAYLLATSPVFLHEFVAFGTIQSLVVCDPQLFNQFSLCNYLQSQQVYDT